MAFYRDLYNHRDSGAYAARLEQFMKSSQIKKLSSEQREQLDAQITEAEVYKYLKAVRNNVAPGSSG